MTPISPHKKNNSIPPLENGDSLSRPEFERRYQAMPHLKKAELIEGIVYIASPLQFESHAEPDEDLISWLGTYKIATPGLRLGDNPTLRLDLDNEPQPDIVLLIDSQYGGQSRLSEEGYIEGAPELVAEISASTETLDFRHKKQAYRRNGVKEYIVWQVGDRKLDWFKLEGGDYLSLMPENGIIRSQIFPGLWLDVAALLAGEMPQVLTTLQTGLTSTQHQAFRKQLTTVQNRQS